MVRRIEIADIEQVNQLYYKLFESLAELEPDYIRPTFQKIEFLETIVKQEAGFIGFVYEQDNEILGFIIAQKQQSAPYDCFKPLNGVYILDIIVDENHRGRSVGSQLIHAIKAWSLAIKAQYLELSVLSKNESAFQLYLKEGFTPFEVSMKIKL